MIHEIIDLGLIKYETAWKLQDEYAAEIAKGSRPPTLLLLEHPHVYTFGRKGQAENLLWDEEELKQKGISVHWVDRGGDITYHGPGQRVAYVMLDLKRRRPDVRDFIARLEEWIIRALDAFGVKGERREERVGVWVARPDKGPGHEDKIAAIGVRLRRWVSFHGISLNVDPDLTHFADIVPCGVTDPRFGVTSLADLGLRVRLADVDNALKRTFGEVFGSSELRLTETTA